MQEEQETQDYDDFQVGDIVYCVTYGKGEVVDIESDDLGSNYPVKVKFNGENVSYYTSNGKWEVGGLRILFFTPPIQGATKRPFVSNLIGRTIFFNYQGSYIRGKVESEDALTIRVSYYSHLEHKISKRFDNDWYIAEEEE